MQPSGENIYADVVNGQSQSLKMAVEYNNIVNVTICLAEFVTE